MNLLLGIAHWKSRVRFTTGKEYAMNHRIYRTLAFVGLIALFALIAGTNPTQAARGYVLHDENKLAPPAATCNSCSDCSAKLASGLYSEVKLTANLIGVGGSCVSLLFGESNVTFDCDYHCVTGDDIAIDPDNGIAFFHGSNNTIRNCLVGDFSGGIYLANAVNHTVENKWLISNSIGLYLSFASGTTVENNIMQENNSGIYLNNASSNTLTNNRVCYNTYHDFIVTSSTGNNGSRNQCLDPNGWNDTGTTGCEYPCWECWLHLPLIAR